MTHFNNENKFRDWLLNEVRTRTNTEGLNFQVLESKNVTDILMCKESQPLPVLALIEVKLYKSYHGRIGIGDAGGQGFQPEILSRRPIYFDRYLRWVISNENGKCVFADNEVVSRNLSGGKITKGQQNNINPKIFDREKIIDISTITHEIIGWLKTI